MTKDVFKFFNEMKSDIDIAEEIFNDENAINEGIDDFLFEETIDELIEEAALTISEDIADDMIIESVDLSQYRKGGSKEGKLPPHLAKFIDPKTGNFTKDAEARIQKGKKSKASFKDVTPKGYGPKESVELDEKAPKIDPDKYAAHMNRNKKAVKKTSASQDYIKDVQKRSNKMAREEISGTGYELYHRDFSGAMKHAYTHAKKKFGITVDSDEIDDKVAMGPRKPGNGKTNTYRLKGDKGNIQVQVYNRGGSKPFELNMYKESVELDEVKGALGMESTAKALEKYAKAFGGPDEKDFMTAARLLRKGLDMKLKKFVNDMDTEPREKVITTMAKTMGKKPVEKMFGVRLREVNEAISMKNSINQYYYQDPKGVVQAVGSKDAMRKMNIKQAKDGNKGGSFSINHNKYKVGDQIKESTEINETISDQKMEMLRKAYSSMPERLSIDQINKLKSVLSKFSKSELEQVKKAKINWLSSMAVTLKASTQY